MAGTPSPRRIGRGAAKAAPRGIPDPPRRVLLASVGAGFGSEVIERALAVAAPEHAKITVLGVVRVYGTSLGLPHPGLQPTRIEWDEARRQVDSAAETIRRKGFEVRVALSRSRNAPKMIAKWAAAKNFHAVVIADPERPRWRQVVEGDLTHEIERRCGVPVHTVLVPALSPGRSRPA